MLRPIEEATISALPGVGHGFFTRQGGVSQGIYASLNCGIGSQDSLEAARENRARIVAHLGGDRLVTPHQVHGTTVATVDAGTAADWRPKADALVTTARGAVLGVLTADCAPILLADPVAGVIGAAHAGWRGAVAGVAEAAIAAMEGVGAARRHIRAAVGPCIGAAVYEVGPELEAEFLAQDAGNARFFARPISGARPHLDLSAYLVHRLRRAEIAAVGAVSACTFTLEKGFYSYRRSRLRGEPDYGRQISAIVLT